MSNRPKYTILVIDDEPDICQLIEYNLVREGFRVILAENGEIALKYAEEHSPDVIVLDLMLPGLDGLEVCKILKSDPKTSDILILMLTAKSEETDIIVGLELGADDYMTKPFSPKILTARVRALLRRKTSAIEEKSGRLLQFGELTIDSDFRTIIVSGEPVAMTATEFDIVYYLAKKPGWVFSRMQIVDDIKGDDYPVTDRSVDFHIAAIRKKLGANRKLIETVRGVGYRFKRIDDEKDAS